MFRYALALDFKLGIMEKMVIRCDILMMKVFYCRLSIIWEELNNWVDTNNEKRAVF